MAAGLVLILLGAWLIGQALAGELAARIIAAARGTAPGEDTR